VGLHRGRRVRPCWSIHAPRSQICTAVLGRRESGPGKEVQRRCVSEGPRKRLRSPCRELRPLAPQLDLAPADRSLLRRRRQIQLRGGRGGPGKGESRDSGGGQGLRQGREGRWVRVGLWRGGFYLIHRHI
jgi:hypothetical protein